MEMRAGVAYFGTFGYELDLNDLSEEERSTMKEQVQFMKKYRRLIQQGTFYRLRSPFEGNETAWMVVSGDRKEALVACYRVLQPVNVGFNRIRLQGLAEDLLYEIEGRDVSCYGDELMQAGLILSDRASGVRNSGWNEIGDFQCRIFEIKAK